MTNDWKKDLIMYRITRANETFEESKIMANADRWNACVNRLYYSCFYAVSALLVLKGLSSTKHAGIRSLFNKNFVKPEIIPKDIVTIYNDLFEKRQEGDYKDFKIFQKEQVEPWISKTEIFVSHISGMIYEWINLLEVTYG